MLHGISTSDWHLDGGLTRFFPLNALEKQLRELEKIFHYALENNIRHIFMPGDLADKARVSEATFIALVTMLLKFDKYVSFRYILGNHDFAQVGKTSLDVLRVFADNGVFKNVHLYEKPETVLIDGVDVSFVPYLHSTAPKTKRGRVIFAHVEEVGAKGDNGVALKSQHLKVVRDLKDYVFSGHLHTHQVLKERRITFNGSPYQKNFGESLPKGFVEFRAKYSAEGKLLVKQEFVDNRPGFRLVELTIEESSQWEELEHGDHVFYKIHLGDGVVAPKNITRDFPNIVSLAGTTYRGRSNLEIAEKTSANDIPKITPLTGLVEYLHNFDLTKAEVKRAVQMVREALRHLANEGEKEDVRSGRMAA